MTYFPHKLTLVILFVNYIFATSINALGIVVSIPLLLVANLVPRNISAISFVILGGYIPRWQAILQKA